MISNKKNTGTVGQIILNDWSSTVLQTVEVYLKSLAESPPFTAVWAYSIDGSTPILGASDFEGGVKQQHIASISVGYATNFEFSLNDTGTVEFGGPTEFLIPLGIKSVDIVEGGIHKRAIPYVKDGGIWKPVASYIKYNGEWKSTS